MQHGAEHWWGGRQLTVGRAVLLLGVLAVFVLVHMGTTHDLALTDLAASGSHEHGGVPGHGRGATASTASATTSAGAAAAHADHEGGHGESGHDHVLVGCLVALTGLVGGLMLLRPRPLAALAAAGVAAMRRGIAAVRSHAVGSLRAPTLATLCVLRT